MSAKLLILTLKPRDLEQALALVIENGVTTLEEKHTGQKLQLHIQIPSNIGAASLSKKLQSLEKKLPKPIFTGIETKILKDESWKKAYQKYLRPFVFPGYPPAVTPLWIDPRGPYPKKTSLNTLIIQGQLAFGTGQHPSTQLAGYLMQKAMAESPVEMLLDVGCGTGILAMVAHRRGMKHLTAVENDPEALLVARANLRQNKIRSVQLLDRLSKVRRKFPLIVANIIAKTLMELKDELARRLQPGGYIILSGLNYRDIPEILNVYGDFRPVERKNKAGWCALWLEKRERNTRKRIG